MKSTGPTDEGVVVVVAQRHRSCRRGGKYKDVGVSPVLSKYFKDGIDSDEKEEGTGTQRRMRNGYEGMLECPLGAAATVIGERLYLQHGSMGSCLVCTGSSVRIRRKGHGAASYEAPQDQLQSNERKTTAFELTRQPM